jgi:hypothetical protein
LKLAVLDGDLQDAAEYISASRTVVGLAPRLSRSS